MFFLCKHSEASKTYLTVKNYPQLEFCESSVNRGQTEVFKLIEWDGGITIMCSCTTPTAYVAKGCKTFTLDPFSAHDFSKSLDFNDSKCTLEHIHYKGYNLTTCAWELEQYGYTIMPNVLNNQQIQTALDALALNEVKDKDQVRRGDLLSRHEIFKEMLTMDPVWTFLTCYMNGDLKCATWSSNSLLRASPTNNLHWHVDYPYHNISPTCWGHPSDPLSLQTLWVLDDFTVDNGATLVIPGSHKFKTIPTAENTQGKVITPLVCKRGSVVVSHGCWWHSQGVNTTDKSRSCLLGTFTKKWIASKDNLQGQYEKLEDGAKTDAFRMVLGL